jgi:hypothetical protein
LGASATNPAGVSPSRASPAAASRIASTSPLASFRRRVSTLPRMSTTATSDRRARSWARRRKLEVPTRVPAGRSAIPVPAAEISTSRGSARAGVATNVKPGGNVAGMSFNEWTARSI